MVEIQNIPIKDLVVNTGQIPGVPKNPRFIKDDRYKKLVQSIQDDPEMLELRELLVYPYEGKNVIIGGNMRFRALKELKYTEAPCKIIETNTEAKKLRAYIIKDNVAFGSDDYDILGNEWDSGELEEWGYEIEKFTSLEELEDKFTLTDEDKFTVQYTFVVPIERKEFIESIFDRAKSQYNGIGTEQKGLLLCDAFQAWEQKI